jgi:glycerate 2-kinase
MSDPHWFHRQLHAAALRAAALQAAEPGACVRRALTRDGDTLYAGGRAYPLAGRRAWLVAAGKAAAPMLAAARALVPEASGVAGVTKDGHAGGDAALREAAHPVPDARSVAAAQALVRLLEQVAPGDLVLLLLSGGASALMTLPVDGVSLEALQDLTNALLRAGATIDELNTVRKHLDRVKGGGLARIAAGRGARSPSAFPQGAAGGADVLVLALSDVPGDPPGVIASGPAAPDPTTIDDARAVLARYGLDGALLAHAVESAKPGEALFARVQHVIVGNVALAAEAAAAQAGALGFTPRILTTAMCGEAREMGDGIARLARQIARRGRPMHAPACLIFGGETTVTVRGGGRGGRCQELALAAALVLDGTPGVQVMALATDGTDGPTDAAGALVTGESVARARALGLDPRAYLDDNDAYAFFAKTGELLMTGPTGTNVNDVVCVLIYHGD